MIHFPGIAEEIPEVRWVHDDDLCNCTFQRVGEWTNPYLGKTLRVRMCCIWADIYKQYPQFVQEIPAYWDDNLIEFIPQAFEWNGEHDMPRAIWYRQLQARTGMSLEEIRDEYRTQEPPKGVPARRTTNGHHVGLRKWYGSLD